MQIPHSLPVDPIGLQWLDSYLDGVQSAPPEVDQRRPAHI